MLATPAFLAAPALPLAAPPARRLHARRGVATTPRRAAPAMLASKRARRRSRRDNSGSGSGSSSDSGSASGSGDASETPGARDADEAYLTSLFSEDVSKPLRAGRAKASKVSKRGGNGGSGGGRRDGPPSGPSAEEVVSALRAQIPDDRTGWLKLLVRGAWFGIGGLVALFFVTHLVLVRDWFPSGAPAAPPAPPMPPS